MPRLFDSIDAQVEIRPDRAEDELALRRLAQLDSAPMLAAPRLIGLVDGEPLAAISLRDRAVVANPFAPTAHLVALLTIRADHVWPRAERRFHPWLRSRRPQTLPSPPQPQGARTGALASLSR
jgi:hypothetical protein